MEIRIVSSEAEWHAALEEMALKGLRLAASSNAGLPKGKVRLTFLPQSAFKDAK